MASLFDPGRIGPIEIKNRLIMPSMTTRGADAEGYVTPDTMAWFVARARGGVGLVTVEMAAPEAVGRHRRRELGVYDDRFLPGLSELVAALHEAGAKASIQLGHGGGHTRRDVCGETPIAPSAVPHVVQEGTTETIVPEAMSPARIEQTTQAYVAAARRARRAGFDCVEIHAAHGYLLSQFCAPAENTRDDAYGGSLANRARFGLDILRRVKAAVPELGIVFRTNLEDFFPGGMPFDEALQVAIWAAEAGADAIHVTAGHYRSLPSAAIMIPPMNEAEGRFLAYARAVKDKVRVPVIAVGRLGNPVLARQVIETGIADFVALGRPLVADPDWPRKVSGGGHVRRCLSCNTCVDEMRAGNRLHCVVNGMSGRERDFDDAKPPKGERIAVIGAGPAGLTYASLVAEGNDVRVFETKPRAGGSLRMAGQAPMFQGVVADQRALDAYCDELVDACGKAGVRVDVGTTPRAEDIAPYDRVVIAVGARYRFGLGPVIAWALRCGFVRRGPLAWLARKPALRDWFYHRARVARGREMLALTHVGQRVMLIGDAAKAGKSQPAILQAFEAALLGRHEIETRGPAP